MRRMELSLLKGVWLQPLLAAALAPVMLTLMKRVWLPRDAVRLVLGALKRM